MLLFPRSGSLMRPDGEEALRLSGTSLPLGAPVSHFFFFWIFKMIYLFERESALQGKGVGRAEGEGEADTPLSREPGWDHMS